MNHLIFKYRTGNYNKEEFQQVKEIIQDKHADGILEEELLAHWNEETASDLADEKEFDRIWLNVEKAINNPRPIVAPTATRRNIRFILSRAAAVLILPLAISFFYLLHHTTKKDELTAENVVKVSRGVVSHMHLPDGTQVWLNAGSKLSYDNTFNKKDRKVLLEGEAYFEVTKNKTKPFIVNGKEMAVKVLGTKFDIKSYPEDASVAVTLMEGSVHLSDGDESRSRILKPNEQAVYSKSTEKLSVNKVNAKNACEWIHGNLIFDNEEFGQIMNCLSREYNITIVVKDKEIEHMRFYGKFRNTQNIEDILTIMTANQRFHYTRKDNTIIVSKN